MIVYAYQRTFRKFDGKDETRIDFSQNIEELIAYYRKEKSSPHYINFAFLKGDLLEIMEIKIGEII